MIHRPHLADAKRALVAIAAISMIVACSTTSDDVAPAVSPAEAVVLATPDASARAVQQPDRDAADGTIRIESFYPMSPDPAVVDEESDVVLWSSYDLIREIHAGLIAIANDPENPYVPDLAQSFQTNSDFTIFTFQLRPNLRFSDGSPLTASDFKWSWERALKLGGADVSRTLGSIRGAAEILAGDGNELDGVQVIDDGVLEVNTVEPDPFFPARVATRAAFVLQRDNVDTWMNHPYDAGPYFYLRQTPATLPVGAGAFMVRWVRTDHTYELVPNPHYHGDPPKIALVELVDFDARTDDLGRFESGGIDAFLWLVAPSNRPDVWAAHEPSNGDGRTVLADRPPMPSVLIFNSAKPPFDDRHFRRALAAASDRFGSFSDRRTEARWNEFDPEAAKSHLAASRYADDVDEFEAELLSVRSGFQTLNFARAADHWVDAVGFVASERWANPEEYRALVSDGKIDFVIRDIAAEFPSIQSIIELTVAQIAEISDGPDVERIEAMLSEARTTVDPVQRERRYIDLGQTLIDEAHVILFDPTFERLSRGYFVRNGIQGFDDPAYGGSRFARAWIER